MINIYFELDNSKASFNLSSISNIKQQKRSEMKKANNSNINSVSENFKNIESIIKSARKNGFLNLSNLSINEGKMF